MNAVRAIRFGNLGRGGSAALVVAVLLAAQTAWANPKTVSFDVTVVHATARPGQPGDAVVVDPALEPIAAFLRESFGGRFTVFRQLQRTAVTVSEGQTGDITLPGDRKLRLTFRGVTDAFIRVAMEMPHLRTSVKVRDGGLFFQAGHAHDGGTLILAIRASLQ